MGQPYEFRQVGDFAQRIRQLIEDGHQFAAAIGADGLVDQAVGVPDDVVFEHMETVGGAQFGNVEQALPPKLLGSVHDHGIAR